MSVNHWTLWIDREYRIWAELHNVTSSNFPLASVMIEPYITRFSTFGIIFKRQVTVELFPNFHWNKPAMSPNREQVHESIKCTCYQDAYLWVCTNITYGFTSSVNKSMLMKRNFNQNCFHVTMKNPCKFSILRRTAFKHNGTMAEINIHNQ